MNDAMPVIPSSLLNQGGGHPTRGRSSHQGEGIPGFNVCHVPGGDDDGEGEKDHRADAPVQPEYCKPNQTNQPYVVFNL